jgi:cytochrome c oxidase subunit 3
MPEIQSSPEVKAKEKYGSSSIGDGGSGRSWGGDDSDRPGNRPPEDFSSPWRPYRLATWLGLASITMVFAGLSSAYFYRLTTATEWNPIPMPKMVRWNTLVLLCSSLTLAFSRGRREGRARLSINIWLFLTLILGIVFLFGQFYVWRELAAGGIYLNSSPAGLFCYLMTGTHAVHLSGGLLGLGFALYRNWKKGILNQQAIATLDVATIYWHFLTGLWVYLFLLLFFFGR